MENNEQKSLEIIRELVDRVLNVNSQIKKKKVIRFDKEKDLFFDVLQRIDKLNTRNNLLYQDLQLDYTNYDDPFYEVIDLLLLSKYGKECYELISFYLWERIAPDQSINYLISTEGEEILLRSPLDLWNLMLKTNPDLEKK